MIRSLLGQALKTNSSLKFAVLTGCMRISKEIRQELTYPEIYQTIDNIWSLLFTAGYLTQRGKAEGRQMKLAIPNLEIRNIFVTQIMELFQENVREDAEPLL